MLSAKFRSLTYMELNHVIQIIDGGRGKGKFLHKQQSYQVRHFVYAYLKVSWITQVQVLNVFIPSPVRVSTLLMDMEVPGTPIGASFFEFELQPTGKYSADPNQHEFQCRIFISLD